MPDLENRPAEGKPTGRRLPIIAIDGPAGVGKSTAARLVADRLNFALLDTGALYRGVALVAKEVGIDWNDAVSLGKMIERLEFAFICPRGRAPRLFIDGQDRSEAIRQPEIALGASRVSMHPIVRERLLGLQRKLGEPGGCVLEGRDIGTVVFPQAEVKVFLTADLTVRAQRRLTELKQRGVETDLESVIRETSKRDAQDSQRASAPLKPASDAVFIDTSKLSVEQVVSLIVRLTEKTISLKSPE